MKKRILSALVATALCLFSCGKDDDNGSSTSLKGDWYIHTMYNLKQSINEYNWYTPNQCSKRTVFEISDNQLKHKRVYEDNSTCKEDFKYYDYTASNSAFHLTITADSPKGYKGQTATINYEMKNKELILRFLNDKGNDETLILHKRGVDYSHLDPFVGYWRLTKVQLKSGKTIKEFKAGIPACFRGDIVASTIGFTIYYRLSDDGVKCGDEERKTFAWAREGNTYYNVSNGQKVPIPFSFSNDKQTLFFGDTNTTLVFQKQW